MSLSTYRLSPSIAVSDMARAQQFYEGQLGLSAVQEGADGSRVYRSRGDTSLHVYPFSCPRRQLDRNACHLVCGRCRAGGRRSSAPGG